MVNFTGSWSYKHKMTQEKNMKIISNNRDINTKCLKFLNVLEEEKFSIEEWKKLPKEQRVLDIEEVIEHNENIESLIYDFKRIFRDTKQT